MGLVDIVKRNTKGLLLGGLLLGSMFAKAQPYDSTVVNFSGGNPNGIVKLFPTDQDDSLVQQNYFVTLDANGDGSIKIPVTNTIGQKEYTLPEGSFVAYPNPSTGSVNVNFDQGITGNTIKWELYNLLGQQIDKGKDSDGLIELDLSTRPNGVYVLRGDNGKGGSAVQKIIKNGQSSTGVPSGRIQNPNYGSNTGTDPGEPGEIITTPNPNDAGYQVQHLLPDGYVNIDSNYIFTRLMQNNVNFTWNPWDSTFVNAWWNVLSNGLPVDGVAISAKPIQMDDILVNTTYKDTTGTNGLTLARDFIAHIDTMGVPTAGSPVYEVKARKEGYVTTTQNVNLQQGVNNLVMTPWDTADASGIVVFQDNQNIFTKFVPLNLEITTMQQLNPGFTWNDATDANGELTILNRPMAIDTTGAPATTSAQLKISWPETVRYDLDSNSVTQSYIGWLAGDTTITIQPGLNQPQSIALQQKPMPNIVGKGFVEFYVQNILTGPNGTTGADADSVLIVTKTNGTTLDSAYVLPGNNGKVVMGPYNHNDNISYAIGYPNGVDINGVARNNVAKGNLQIQGNTLNTIAAGDTSQYVGAVIFADSSYSKKNNIWVATPIAHIKDINQYGQEQGVNNPNGMLIFVDTLDYLPYQRALVSNVMDTLINQFNTWTDAKYTRTYSPYTNTGTYSPLTHGTNWEQGAASASASIGGIVNGQGTIRYVFPMETSGPNITENLREMGQLLGLDGTSFPGAMGLSGATELTDLDCALIDNLMFFYGKAIDYNINKTNGLITVKIQNYVQNTNGIIPN